MFASLIMILIQQFYMLDQMCFLCYAKWLLMSIGYVDHLM
jgi:hypothetical protein